MRGRDPKMQTIVFSTLILEVVHRQVCVLLVTPGTNLEWNSGRVLVQGGRDHGRSEGHDGSQFVKETCTKEVAYDLCLRMHGVLCEEQRRV